MRTVGLSARATSVPARSRNVAPPRAAKDRVRTAAYPSRRALHQPRSDRRDEVLLSRPRLDLVFVQREAADDLRAQLARLHDRLHHQLGGDPLEIDVAPVLRAQAFDEGVSLGSL